MSRAGLASVIPLPVVIAILGAVTALVAQRVSRRAPLIIGVACLAGCLVILILLAPTVYGGTILTHFLGNVSPVHGHALGIAFMADPFGLSFAFLTVIIGVLLLAVATSELGGLGHREIGGFTCLFMLLIAALLGVALTADSIDLFVWFEVAALASYGLTGFFLERPLALEGAFKIMVLTNMAAFGIFIASALLYDANGALNLGQLHIALSTSSLSSVDLVALALLVAGFATKAGIMPWHGWLADAHTPAPGPVSALFSGLMVNLGIVAIARYTLDVYPTSPRPVLGLLTVLGAASAIGGALLALTQDDLKRLLAYDTVSQMGVLLVGISTATPSGLAGTTYHLLAHALFKSLLFLAAGSVVHATGMTKLSQMGGLARHRPVTTIAFTVGAASIAGLPPLSGYVSLGLIHDSLRHGDPAAFAAMLIAQVLTVAALGRATYLAFFRRRDDDYDRLERPAPGTLIGFTGLIIGCVSFGVLPGLILRDVAAPAAAALTEPSAWANAALHASGRLTAPNVPFDYWSPTELATALGTIAVGLLIARWWIRRDATPAPARWIRAVHTGSVNDYATYAAVGLALVLAVILTG